MSIDRTLGVASVVATLVGAGLLYLYPNKVWLGWTVIGLGVATVWGAVFWALGGRHALREKASTAHLNGWKPASRQTLNQHAPITNKNTGAPVFAPVFAPSFNQSQIERETRVGEQKPTCDPVFEVRGLSMPRYGLNLQTGELIREEYTGDPSEVFEHIVFVKALLVKFYYRPDPGVDSRLRVNAHVFICLQESGAAPKEIYQPLWDDDEPHVSKEFSAGYAHELIIGLVLDCDEPVGVMGYEYSTKKLSTDIGDQRIFAPKLFDIAGDEFKFKVELIPKLHGDVRCKLPDFWFELFLSSDLEFKVYKDA